MELVLPKNYVEVPEEEMMYLDGGVSIPNWAVATGINGAISATIFAIIGGGGGMALFRTAISRVGRSKFETLLCSYLTRTVGVKMGSTAIAVIMDNVVGSDALSVGSVIASWIDRNDRCKNNGYWDI